MQKQIPSVTIFLEFHIIEEKEINKHTVNMIPIEEIKQNS
jgi:hypothetical protein